MTDLYGKLMFKNWEKEGSSYRQICYTLTSFTERGSDVMFTPRDLQKQKAGHFSCTTLVMTKACTEHSFSCLCKILLMVAAVLDIGLSETHKWSQRYTCDVPWCRVHSPSKRHTRFFLYLFLQLIWKMWAHGGT